MTRIWAHSLGRDQILPSGNHGIRRFAKLVIRESADLRERFHCRLEAASGSDELQCDCRVFVKITNLNPDVAVVIPARKVVQLEGVLILAKLTTVVNTVVLG